MRKEQPVIGARTRMDMVRARVFAPAVLVCGLMGLMGCEVDSFMDPSTVGRWENTPVVLPILERLDVIDEPKEEIAGLRQIQSDDLIPDVVEYRIGPGDVLLIEVQDLLAVGSASQQTRRVDELGMVPRLPFIGSLSVEGLTAREVEGLIAGKLVEDGILADPIVTVILTDRREATFSVLGTAGTGTYAIVQNNFRLLDAVALAGGVPPTVEKIYVIRQTPLVAEVERGRRPLEAEGEGATEDGAGPTEDGAAGEGGAGAGAEGETADPGALISELASAVEAAVPAAGETAAGAGEGAGEAATPVVDPSSLESVLSGGASEGQFVHVPGRGWEMVANGGGGGGSNGESGEGEGGMDPGEMVTQQVIEVDARRLMMGEARYNIVVRPGDVIKVPVEVPGLVYLMGPGINRGGVFNLSDQGRTTVKQIVAAAGGLSQVAIPERVDLVRRVTGTDEATVRINLRAIFEGVQPDFYLRSHDTLNFGTNLFASHLAVIRNSFRFSYGMGFLLDRNFGTDVFGPIDRQGGF